MKDTSGLAFNGQGGEGYSRLNKYEGNHFNGKSDGSKNINKGRGPTVGNKDFESMRVGPSATKDSYREAPATVGVSGREVPKIKNTDSINYGKQERNPGGTRSWDPKKGQNYSGNPDMIRIGQSGGPGYGTVGKSKNPQEGSAKKDNFNYGPKSQY